jgi:hypothetical protein
MSQGLVFFDLSGGRYTPETRNTRHGDQDAPGLLYRRAKAQDDENAKPIRCRKP